MMAESRVPRRIIHCAETIKGGIASYLRELIPLQCKEYGAGNILVIIPQGQVAELPVPEGVVIETFDDRAGRAQNGLRLALRGCSLARSFGADIVHVHSSFAGFFVRPCLRLFYPRSRIVYCAHGWAWDRPMSKFGRFAVVALERALSLLTPQIVCISEHERQAALNVGISGRRLRVVRNGVAEIAPAAPVIADGLWPADCLRVLFVGRFDLQKGVDVFFDALNSLSDEAHAVVAGAAVLADGAALKAPANTTLVGWKNSSELQALFSAADVLVVPSRWEGFGLIAAEGMRAGLAVVASRVGGLSEIVEDGVTGILIAPGSSLKLVNALKGKSRDSWREMGQRGRERFLKHFTMDRVHAELCKTYSDVM